MKNWRGVKGREKNFLVEMIFNIFFIDNDLLIYFDAISSSEGKIWKEAIKNKIDSIIKNKT